MSDLPAGSASNLGEDVTLVAFVGLVAFVLIEGLIAKIVVRMVVDYWCVDVYILLF